MQLDLFSNAFPSSQEKPIEQEGKQDVQKNKVNPCLALYGIGLEGQTCKDCIHLRYPLGRNPHAHHWKCDLRKLTHGSATDHRVNWPSCARYEKRTEDYHGG